MLRHNVPEWKPDLVVVAFTTGNDIRNNSAVLETDRLRPFATVDNGALDFDTSFIESPEYQASIRHQRDPLMRIRVFLRQNIRLYQLLARTRRGFTANGQQDTTTPGMEPGIDEMVYMSHPGPDREAAWAITERLLVEMQRTAEDLTAEFVLVSVSNAIQVDPRPEVRSDFLTTLGPGADLFEPERRLQAIATAHDIRYIALAPRLQEIAETSGIFLHGFANTPPGRGHWNQIGHKLAGEMIAEDLCRFIHRYGRDGSIPEF